ncbi:MAG: S8 family serine peptidase, partial [Luteolibacter sp.]
GARLINISLGSPGDSALVRNAIEYARSAGAMIIAAAGNNGVQKVSYPAANAGVVAVGAVDAVGNHLNFSNTGPQVALSAPGFEVNAAWSGDQAASVSGTSFSSPIVAGAIAAVMSQPGSKNLTNSQALALINAYLNDAGAAGGDEFLGAGMPDLGRVINRNTRGIYDAALASQRVLPPSPGHPNGQIEVLVQNRGTETLINTQVQISTPTGKVTSNITSLPVNAVRSIRVPINESNAKSLRYESRVSLSSGGNDAKPSNDRRVESYAPTVTK